MAEVPGGAEIFELAYNAVEDKVLQVQEYVTEWLRYQSLWDLQADQLYNELGEGISKWMDTLVEIKLVLVLLPMNG